MLSDKQYEAIRLLADPSVTQDEVAERVGVSRTTLWRWRQEREFQDEQRNVMRARILPHVNEVLDSMITQATKHGSSRAADIVLKTADMYNTRVEVSERPTAGSVSMTPADIKARAAEFLARRDGGSNS